jgi:hypothetical protein
MWVGAQLAPTEHFLDLLSLVDVETHYVPNSHLTFYQLNSPRKFKETRRILMRGRRRKMSKF